jgi:hypothetical protein
MSERARIISWWIYVALVIAIFEVVFQLSNFAFAVGAALVSMVVLGIALKLLVGRLVNRGTRASGTRRSLDGNDTA